MTPHNKYEKKKRGKEGKEEGKGRKRREERKEKNYVDFCIHLSPCPEGAKGGRRKIGKGGSKEIFWPSWRSRESYWLDLLGSILNHQGRDGDPLAPSAQPLIIKQSNTPEWKILCPVRDSESFKFGRA